MSTRKAIAKAPLVAIAFRVTEAAIANVMAEVPDVTGEANQSRLKLPTNNDFVLFT